jgi:sulfate adenylyltransferase subunit 2
MPDNIFIMDDLKINHLRELEAESIYVIREVAAQFERPTLLFSGGKDSIVLFHLARKAFWPSKVPFPLLHIDTGHNFQETLDFRDRLMEETGQPVSPGWYRIR